MPIFDLLVGYWMQMQNNLNDYRDKWFRVGAMLLSLGIAIYGSGIFSQPSWVNVGQLLVAFAAGVLIIEGSRFLVYNGRSWFSKYRGGLFIFLTGVVATTLIMSAAVVLKNYIRTGELKFSNLTRSHIIFNNTKVVFGLLGMNLSYALFLFPFLFGTFEFFYHSANQRVNVKKQEELEKQKLKAELQQLKGIVNPHFLFNNLNSLSSLMEENVQQAQSFLDELTKVFRYLLRNNNTDLTTLEEELQFINSYYRLLQTRYTSGINLHININDDHLHLLIPPLTLQLLVENAVKHNQHSAEKPLTIELLSHEENKLIVKNNIQPKKVLVESTGIGLQNIRMRYAMLNEPGIKIQKDEKSFAIIMQLIDPSRML